MWVKKGIVENSPAIEEVKAKPLCSRPRFSCGKSKGKLKYEQADGLKIQHHKSVVWKQEDHEVNISRLKESVGLKTNFWHGRFGAIHGNISIQLELLGLFYLVCKITIKYFYYCLLVGKLERCKERAYFCKSLCLKTLTCESYMSSTTQAYRICETDHCSTSASAHVGSGKKKKTKKLPAHPIKPEEHRCCFKAKLSVTMIPPIPIPPRLPLSSLLHLVAVFSFPHHRGGKRDWSISFARGEENSLIVSSADFRHSEEGWVRGALGRGGDGDRQRWQRGTDTSTAAAQSCQP